MLLAKIIFHSSSSFKMDKLDVVFGHRLRLTTLNSIESQWMDSIMGSGVALTVGDSNDQVFMGFARTCDINIVLITICAAEQPLCSILNNNIRHETRLWIEIKHLWLKERCRSRSRFNSIYCCRGERMKRQMSVSSWSRTKGIILNLFSCSMSPWSRERLMCVCTLFVYFLNSQQLK